jgi:hypothetical protein
MTPASRSLPAYRPLAPRPRERSRGLRVSGFALLLLAASAGGCIPKVQWELQSSTGYVPSGHAVSVFGVYKDGQMSSEAWDSLRTRLEPALGGRACEIADGNRSPGDATVFTAIDDYARTNGPTDALLSQLAPAAEGDLILVLVEAGQLPAHEKVSVVNSTAPGPSGTTQGKAGFSLYPADKRAQRGQGDLLQFTATLFSVAQGRSVALLDMRYSGDSLDEAETEFTTRLRGLLPAASCKGWNWSAGVDADRIRKLAEE